PAPSESHSPSPALHSVPTRRSSDLRSEEGGNHLCDPMQRAGADLVVAQARGARADLGVRFAARLALRRERQHADVRERQGAVGEDRKSTRLNSSHEWISYAVFCLKK